MRYATIINLVRPLRGCEPASVLATYEAFHASFCIPRCEPLLRATTRRHIAVVRPSNYRSDTVKAHSKENAERPSAQAAYCRIARQLFGSKKEPKIRQNNIRQRGHSKIVRPVERSLGDLNVVLLTFEAFLLRDGHHGCKFKTFAIDSSRPQTPSLAASIF